MRLARSVTTFFGAEIEGQDFPFQTVLRGLIGARFEPRRSRLVLERAMREHGQCDHLFDPSAIARGECVATRALLFPRVTGWVLRLSPMAGTPGVSLRLPQAQIGGMAELLRWGLRTDDARTFRRKFFFLGAGFLEKQVRRPSASRRPWRKPSAPGIYRREHASLVIRSERTTLLFDPIGLKAELPRIGESPLDMDLRPDAILVTHGHGDHWHMASILFHSQERDVPIIVPEVPGPTILSPTDFGRTLRLAGQAFRAPAWGKTLRVGDIEIDILPFYGEQPARRIAAVDPGVRNWGNCYRINCPGFSALLMTDAGADPAGDMVEVLRESRRKRGPVDALLACVRTFAGPFFGGLLGDWVPLPFESLRGLFRLYERGRLPSTTAGPEGIVDLCEAAGARNFLPYADGFEGVGARISDVGWGDGESSEDRLVSEIGSRLRARGVATRALAWKPGDAVRFGGDARIVC